MCYILIAGGSKNLAPHAISIFSSDGERIDLPEEARTGTGNYAIANDDRDEKKPALAITCDLSENGRSIKKLLESVIKTPLKYVRYQCHFFAYMLV